MHNIGDKVKKLRELKGFKQEYMAEKLSISQQSYSNLENGKMDVPFSKIEQIADLFGMRVEDMVSFDEKVVFNLNAQHTSASNNNGIYHHNNFPEKLQQLYEDKIRLLEEKIAWLEKGVKQ
jgi:transcriptional regulator with XRE-family HTH domain